MLSASISVISVLPTQPPIRWVLSGGYSDWRKLFTTYFHVEQNMRMRGAILLLLVYTFMIWTETHIGFAFFMSSWYLRFRKY
jgi:hypothetical protein